MLFRSIQYNRKIRQARTIKTVLSIILNRAIYGKQLKQKIQNFLEYIGEMNVSETVMYLPNEVGEIARQYDVILSGSDQLWNERITGDDMTYFCPFKHNLCCFFTDSQMLKFL